MKVLVFSATYNEAGNVLGLLNGIHSALPSADILIVDDGSRDGTVEVMKGARLPQLSIVERPGKMGLGTAHLLAFCHAVHYGYDILVTMDADGSHEPHSIPDLVQKIKQGHDFSIGSRYMAGGSCDYSGYRLWVSRLANIGARMLLGIKLSEFTTSFRAFRVTKLGTLSFSSLMVGGYSFFLTTVVEAGRRNFSMSEIPIHFKERGYGVSKIPSFEIFRGMLNLSRLAVIKMFCRKPRLEHQALHPCPACGSAYALIQHGDDGGHTKCVQCGVVA